MRALLVKIIKNTTIDNENEILQGLSYQNKNDWNVNIKENNKWLGYQEEQIKKFIINIFKIEIKYFYN